MRRLISAVIISLFMVMAFAIPVLAIDDPDTSPDVNAVFVYEDLEEDGDVGVLIDYYIDYSVTGNPTETATEAYIAIFVDIDGVTQLKTVAPYTYQDGGYGRGLIWIYFTAAEVTADNITSGNVALYEIWLVGNPTLDWDGDPPKTIASIDDWQVEGSNTAVLLALRVLYYADLLELLWSLDLIGETALGNRLTTLGESYFVNVIPSLRDKAPSAFSAGQYDPVMEDLDYATSFGAILTNATGTATGSPITLTEGANDVDVLTLGTFTIELNRGTEGTATSDGCDVVGTPATLRYGTNTITTETLIGNIVVDVELVTTQTTITDTITGTALDLTDLAATFGMTRLMFSGLVWMVVSIIICAATFKVGEGAGVHSGGKVVFFVFEICVVVGAVLGLLSMLVAIILFIGVGALIGYVLFFRGAHV